MVRGHYRSETETAIEEYLNASQGGDTHDRLNRIEDRIDDLADAVDTLLRVVEGKKKEIPSEDSGTSTVTADGGAKGVVARREQAVADALRKRHSTMFSETDLVKLIEQEAGVASDDSIEQYKDRLCERFNFPYINPPSGVTLYFWNEDDRDEYYDRTWGDDKHDDPWEPLTGES